jgi:hypothetical protein
MRGRGDAVDHSTGRVTATVGGTEVDLLGLKSREPMRRHEPHIGTAPRLLRLLPAQP